MLNRGNWQNFWIEDLDFDKFISIAEKNKVLSTISSFIFENKIEKLFRNSGVYHQLLESLLLNKRDLQVYKKNLSYISDQFSRNNIAFCLLKGLSLKGKLPRDMGDLDILIHPEDLERAIGILEEQGYTYQGYIRNDLIRKKEARDWNKLLQWNNQFQFLDPLNAILVEVHTGFFERRRVYPFNLDPFLNEIDDVWKRTIDSEELQCRILSPEDRFWLLSMHNSINRCVTKKSFVLRNILDMKNLINSQFIDWPALFERARKSDTLVFIIYSLEMINTFIPGCIDKELIFYGNQSLSVKKKLMKKIMHSCYIDLEKIHYLNRFLYNLLLPFIQKSRFTQKLKSIFILPVFYPSPRRLRQIYGLQKESVLVICTYFLEPFRWFIVAMGKLKKA
jgi:hypothetical protein